ncbi:hypothetical protein TNCV_2474931 [Trichonephila clavipes]|nr:hypothetical protein TNCV_2474931 [Trichonephila clavipes]
MQIPDVPKYVQIPNSQVPQPPMQFLHVPELMQILSEPMQILPELDILDPLESTLDQLMSFVFGRQELQLPYRAPSIFDGDLI